MTNDSSGRRTWAVVKTDLSRTAAEQVCSAILDVMSEQAPWACIDAWSDYRDELPAEVEEAEAALRQLHVHRDGQSTGMGISINRLDPAQEALLRAYAAWSIHVEVLPAAGQAALVTFHDGATAITAELSETEVDRLRHRLAGVATLELLERLHADATVSRKQARRRRRGEQVQRWLGWLPWRGAQRQADRGLQEEQLQCEECGHPQGAHPWPGRRDLKACAVCVDEEDHELREEAAMCRRTYHRPS